MYDLKNITLDDAVAIGEILRTLGSGATSMEEVADRTIRYLCSNLGDGESDQRSCVLVRFYKTDPYKKLPSDLQEYTCKVLGTSSVSADMNCLALLASVGDRAE